MLPGYATTEVPSKDDERDRDREGLGRQLAKATSDPRPLACLKSTALLTATWCPVGTWKMQLLFAVLAVVGATDVETDVSASFT